MPHDRTLIYAGQGFTVEHLRSHAKDELGWSGPYTIESRRIIFPAGRTVLDVRWGDSTWQVDALTAMHLVDAMIYQLRPVVRAVRQSVVVSRHRPARPDSTPAFRRLSPKSLYRVHLAQRQLRRGDGGATAIASLVAELETSHQQMPLTSAVASAKQLLAETADREARLSLRELADAVSRSPFHLARSFRLQTGLSLHQYRQHLRIASALERLADGDTDLAGIAHDLGYCSQSHLGAVFRRDVGVTLGEARRALA